MQVQPDVAADRAGGAIFVSEPTGTRELLDAVGRAMLVRMP
jgi:hypothetical protein